MFTELVIQFKVYTNNEFLEILISLNMKKFNFPFQIY